MEGEAFRVQGIKGLGSKGSGFRVQGFGFRLGAVVRRAQQPSSDSALFIRSGASQVLARIGTLHPKAVRPILPGFLGTKPKKPKRPNYTHDEKQKRRVVRSAIPKHIYTPIPS